MEKSLRKLRKLNKWGKKMYKESIVTKEHTVLELESMEVNKHQKRWMNDWKDAPLWGIGLGVGGGLWNCYLYLYAF